MTRPVLPMGYILRKVTAQDVPAAIALEAASYPEDEAATPEKIAFRCDKANDFFYILCKGADLAGFVMGTCTTNAFGGLDDASMSAHDTSGEGPLALCLHSVVVAESLRSQGLGRAMVCEYLRRVVADDACKRVQRMLLIAKAPKLELYASCGFAFERKSPVVHGKDSWFEMAMDARDVFAVPIVQVDAFTTEPFAGNPAAVMFTQRGGDEAWMLAAAQENNLAETAFLEARAGAQEPTAEWDLRWFSPACEVDLCGHATLASAHALWESGRAPAGSTIKFHTRKAGVLTATSVPAGGICMQLPCAPLVEALTHAGLAKKSTDVQADLAHILRALGVPDPKGRAGNECFMGPEAAPDLLFVLDRAEWDAVADCPDYAKIQEVTTRLAVRGVIVTVGGDGCAGGPRAAASRLYAMRTMPPIDFCSRFFAPAFGINEDPVTGSAHSILARFWTERRTPPDGFLYGYQASQRGGLLRVRVHGDYVDVEGHARTTLWGNFEARP